MGELFLKVDKQKTKIQDLRKDKTALLDALEKVTKANTKVKEVFTSVSEELHHLDETL